MSNIKLKCPKCSALIITDSCAASCRCPKCSILIPIKRSSRKKSEPAAPAAETSLSDSALAYADGLLAAENFAAAEKAYRSTSKKFPDDYRVWWGIVRAGTQNFTTLTGNDCSAEYSLALKNAPASVAKPMKTTYEEYLSQRAKASGSTAPVAPMRSAEDIEREEKEKREAERARAKEEARRREEERVRVENARKVAKLRDARAAKLDEIKELKETLASLESSLKFDSISILKTSYPRTEMIFACIFAALTLTCAILIMCNVWIKWLLWVILVLLALITLGQTVRWLSELRHVKRNRRYVERSQSEYNADRAVIVKKIEKINAEIYSIEEQLAALSRTK